MVETEDREIYKKSGIKPEEVKPEIHEEKCGESIENGLKTAATSHTADEMPPKTENVGAVSGVRRQILVIFLEKYVFPWLPRNWMEALRTITNDLDGTNVVIKLEGGNFRVYRCDFNRLAEWLPLVPANELIPVYEGKLEDLLNWILSNSGNGSIVSAKKGSSN